MRRCGHKSKKHGIYYMKVLQINSVCGIRSTGKIAADIAESFIANGDRCIIAYGREIVPEKYQKISYRIGNEAGVRFNGIKARIFDNEGLNAKKATKKFLKWADEYDPDLLWLHNIHGYYINVEMLFNWIKKRPQMEVRWTLHDCWAFTGHCTHFSFVGCNLWKTGCKNCCQKNQYPASFLIDSSENNYLRKKSAFTGVKNLTIITPSEWLADLVKQSFLKEYPVAVEYNKINKSIFKPTESNFREKYGLADKKIVLGVASSWSERKGLSDFMELNKLLDDSYKIVLVGPTNKQMKNIAGNTLCLPGTNNSEELAAIYTAADVFLNPSKEETFGLTTVEALSCGTPAIVYKDTACEEIVGKYGGIAVDRSVGELYKAVCGIFKEKQT